MHHTDIKDRRRVCYYDLSGLFVIAAVLRLLYLKLAVANLGFDSFALYAPDSRLYLALADHILSFNEQGAYGLFRVGPGYALMLAAVKALFGDNLIWPILLSVLMGALAPVFIYLLADRLFDNRAIALTAGIISTVSLTSIAASTHILTDQPYFTIHAASLVCFVYAYQTGRLRWFIIAGVVAGFGLFTRPVGVIWPFVFLFLALVIPVSRIYKSRFHLVRRVGVTGIVMLLVMLGWSTRNYLIHGQFLYTTNGMLTVRSCLIAQVAQNTWGEGKRIGDYRDEWESIDGDRSDEFAASYGRAKERVLSVFKQQPGQVLHYYWNNLWENLVAPNYYVPNQIPQFNWFAQPLNRAMQKWLGYLLVLLTSFGLWHLFRDGHLFAFWLLGSTYLSFSIFLGASFWQGSRLHYPAEMAWSIVLAFLAVQTADKLRTWHAQRQMQR